MRLESALLTSREGITAHGQAIAVVGDNIANVSTTAYKTARPEFTDILGEAAGARNSATVTGAGDGVQVGRVRTIQESGPIEVTGRELDVSISGGGFFMVGAADAPQLTRAGNLEINAQGNLSTSFGQEILGYSGADLANLGAINMFAVNTVGIATTQVQMYGNVNGSAPVAQPPANPEKFRDVNDALSFGASQVIYDSQGTRHDVLVAFFRTATNTWQVRAYAEGSEVGGTAGAPTLLGEATLTFNGNGSIEEAQRAGAQLNVTANWVNGAAPTNATIDLGNFTQFSGNSLINNIIQDGRGVGSISGYEFETDGRIFARLDTGERSQVGTIPLAVFKSSDGLLRTGTSAYSPSEESGELEVGKAGIGLRGSIEGKTLERSTVDIAKQFVDLVVYQRGYQANSQVLSAASELLQGTIQLIR
jgi:flagellar hook protein FlgE